MLHTLVKTGVSLAAITLVLEVLLRLTGISYPYFTQVDSLTALSLRPGAEGWQRGEGKAYVHINSHGMRDIEHVVHKSPGTLRIAILGDSYAEARQVTLADTFWKQLEEQLVSCPVVGKQVIEVLNFGTTSFSTAQALIQLRERALLFNPDIVVLTFNADDVRNNVFALDGNAQRPYMTVDEGGNMHTDYSFRDTKLFQRQSSWWSKTFHVAVLHSRVLQIINQRLKEIRQQRLAQSETADDTEAGISVEIYQDPPLPEWEAAWNTTEDILESMHRIASNNDAHFVLLTTSAAFQVHPDTNERQNILERLKLNDAFYPERRLKIWTQKHAVTFIPTAETLGETALTNGTFFHGFSNTSLGSGHWNEVGHALVSNLLATKICILLST